MAITDGGDNTKSKGPESNEAKETELNLHFRDNTVNGKNAEGARPTDLTSAQDEKRLFDSVNNPKFVERNQARIASVLNGDLFDRTQLAAVIRDNYSQA